MDWMLKALEDAGYAVILTQMPYFNHRIVVWWKNHRCIDRVRGSRRAAIRSAYFTLIEPEQEMLDKLTLAERTEVLRVRQEMSQ